MPADVQALLGDYAEALSQFRQLQQRLRPLLDSLAARHAGRRPTREEVAAEAGSVPGAAYGEYLDLRRRLMVEIPRLRGRLEEVMAGPGGGGRPELDEVVLLARRKGGSVSCNSEVHSPQVNAVGQWVRAKDYRRGHSRQQQAGGLGEEAAAAAAASPSASATQPASILAADSSTSPVAAHAVPSVAASSTPPPSPSTQLLSKVLLERISHASSNGQQDTQVQAAPAAEIAAGTLPGPAAAAGSGSDARLQLAAKAAAAYRKAKAEPKTGGQAAAAAAAAPVAPAAEPGSSEAAGSPPPGELPAVVETARFDMYAGRKNRSSDDAQFLMLCP